MNFQSGYVYTQDGCVFYNNNYIDTDKFTEYKRFHTLKSLIEYKDEH